MPRRWVTHASPYSAYAPRITSVSLCVRNRWPRASDRKSTRLNSSHTVISYAVFCLKPSAPTSTLFPYTTLFRSPVVERLLAQAVTGEEERAARAVPDREGEHAAEMGDARLAVLGVRAQNHLGVALCPEPVAPGLQLGAEAAEVVDLAVEDDHQGSRRIGHRLPSGAEVDDREARHPQGGLAIVPGASVVGPRIREQGHHRRDEVGRWGADPAHDAEIGRAHV